MKREGWRLNDEGCYVMDGGGENIESFPYNILKEVRYTFLKEFSMEIFLAALAALYLTIVVISFFYVPFYGVC